MECDLNFSRIMKLNIILIILIIHQPFMWFVQGRGNSNNNNHNNNSNNNSDNNTNNNNNNNSENNTSNNNHKNNNNHHHNSNNNNNNNNYHYNHDTVSSCTTVCVCKWKGGKQTVECIDRNLITIPDNIDQNTQVLDMSGNNLQILPHDIFIRAGLLNLQKLYLRNCRLGQINDDAFNGLTNLVELDLSNNILTNIPTSVTLQHIPSLRELTIALNPIQKIDSFAFKQTYSLTKLDLSHCDIRTIAPDAFKGIHSLHSLKLNGNKLSELRPRTIETLSKLHNIELHDNPWLCDCRLRATKLWLTQNNIPYPVQPICLGGPERIVNRTFAELLIDDFACKPELLPIPRFIETTAGENASITCRTSAVPSATINWYWNGRSLLNNSAFSSYQKIYLEESGEYDKSSRLVLTNAQETDSSDFYCVAENRAGMVEANFTLHVGMRQAGMASLGSGQIVGLSAALVVIILLILLIILFLLIRLRHLPFTETKTPGHLEIVTTTVSPQSNSINGGKSCSTTSTTNEYGLVQTGGATTITTLTGAGTMTMLTTGTPTTSTTTSLVTTSTIPLSGGIGLMSSSSSSSPSSIDRRQSNTDLKITNPLQKPPRLTDMSYTTSHYDGNGSILSSAAMYISPSAATTMTSTITSVSRASSGNNPDLINDTKCFDGTINSGGILTTIDQQHLIDEELRPGSGEYSRAGFDSLYPSGLWETHNISSVSPSSSSISTATTITAGTHNNHNHQHHQTHPLFATMQSSALVAQDLYLKRAASSTIPQNYDYTEKTPIINGSHHNITNTNYDNDNDEDIDNERLKSSIEYMSRTFPRTAVVAHQLVNNLNSNKINNNNNTNINNNLNTTNDNNSNSNNNNNISINKNKNNISGYPSDYGLPIVPGAEQHKRDQLLPPNGMPTNAKTLRVWQRGGVPVLPPVTALKRALTNSRNSPDEGYQEGCGTDV